jgi:hypothetical protein
MVVSMIGVWLSMILLAASCGIGRWCGTAQAMMLLGMLVLILLAMHLLQVPGVMVVSMIGVWLSMILLAASCGVGI